MREPMRINSTCGMARSSPEVVEFVVRQKERVASAQEDISNFRMFANVLEATSNSSESYSLGRSKRGGCGCSNGSRRRNGR